MEVTNDADEEIKKMAKKLKIDKSCQPQQHKSWRGSSVYTFTKLLKTNMNFPPLICSKNHSVHFKMPLRDNQIFEPHPKFYEDKWDNIHVKLPCSQESRYHCDNKNTGRSETVSRWSVIQEAFMTKIGSFDELRSAILSYNQRYASRWTFPSLKYLLEEEFCEEEAEYFYENILPKIIKLALDLPLILTKPPPLLKKTSNSSITLSQLQVASLLANAFLCTFPRRNATGNNTEYSTYPDINFNRLFSHSDENTLEKLKCIIHYFKEISSRNRALDSVVTYTRQHISESVDFCTSSGELTQLHVNSEGFIENAAGFLQVDFANKYIGGGVLGQGCVQEEIRFVLCPELILARLFTEVLEKSDALIISGVEQFSKYKGYASTFRWDGRHNDITQHDPYKRKLCQIVAIDAICYTNPKHQYKKSFILRELHKAYAGFKAVNRSEGCNVAIATGNWGCGAFRGDVRLKALIQIATASLTKRDVAYFTFGDESLRDELANLHQFLVENKIAVGQLVMCLCQFGLNANFEPDSLFSYIYKTFSHYDSDTDSDSGSIKNNQAQSSSQKSSENLRKTNQNSENLSKSQNTFEDKNKSIHQTSPIAPRKVGKKITDYFKATSKTGEKSGLTSSERSILMSKCFDNSIQVNQRKRISDVNGDKGIDCSNQCLELNEDANFDFDTELLDNSQVKKSSLRDKSSIRTEDRIKQALNDCDKLIKENRTVLNTSHNSKINSEQSMSEELVSNNKKCRSGDLHSPDLFETPDMCRNSSGISFDFDQVSCDSNSQNSLPETQNSEPKLFQCLNQIDQNLS